MSFIYSRTLKQKPPIRVYLHREGHTLFSEPYNNSTVSEIDRIKSVYPEIFQSADFMIAMLWGLDGSRVARIYGYGRITKWPGEPEMHFWTFENGIYTRAERKLSNSDISRVRELEEDYRRTTRSLEHYMSSMPKGALKLRPQGKHNSKPAFLENKMAAQKLP